MTFVKIILKIFYSIDTSYSITTSDNVGVVIVQYRSRDSDRIFNWTKENFKFTFFFTAKTLFLFLLICGSGSVIDRRYSAVALKIQNIHKKKSQFMSKSSNKQ